MRYHISLSPELGLSPADFAAIWNETPECRDVARACLSRVESAQFDSALLAVTLSVAADLAIGLAANFLYDLIKQALTRRGICRQAEIVQVEQPDGSRILVVSVREERES